MWVCSITHRLNCPIWTRLFRIKFIQPILKNWDLYWIGPSNILQQKLLFRLHDLLFCLRMCLKNGIKLISKLMIKYFQIFWITLECSNLIVVAFLVQAWLQPTMVFQLISQRMPWTNNPCDSAPPEVSWIVVIIKNKANAWSQAGTKKLSMLPESGGKSNCN